MLQTLAVFGLLAGLMLAQVAASAVDSAVATIYCAFGEDPEAMKRNHPTDFGKLYYAWKDVSTREMMLEHFNFIANPA